MTRTIAAILYPGCLSLDLVGPMEAFNYAAMETASASGTPAYRPVWLAPEAGPVPTLSGLNLHAEAAFMGFDEPIDTILVPGMRTGDFRFRDFGLPAWIAAQAPNVRRVASVCSGALILGDAGLLAGRRVTTHWMDSEDLRRLCPDAQVQADCIFQKDGPIYSSGGVTAGIDLALAMIAEDLGHRQALSVARRMIVHLKRSGDQSQYSDLLAAQARAERFGPLLDWIEKHLKQPLSVEALAEHAAMSPRNFSRQFHAEVGLSPMHYVTGRRLEQARLLLDGSDRPISTIAADAGFDSDAKFRRAFAARFSISPSTYRERFGRNDFSD